MSVQITDAIMNRLTMATISKDMDRWIEKRDSLSHKADDLRKQKEILEKDSSVSCAWILMCACLLTVKLALTCS